MISCRCIVRRGVVGSPSGVDERGESDASHIKDLINGSHCFLIATSEKTDRERPIIGMGRSISDGVSDAYIQDVVVMPSCRGQGIATRDYSGWLVDRLQEDGIEWIGLIAETKYYTESIQTHRL